MSAVFLFYGCASQNYMQKQAEKPASYEKAVLDRAEENKKRLVEICKDNAYLKDPNLTQGQIEFYNATCRFYVDDESVKEQK